MSMSRKMHINPNMSISSNSCRSWSIFSSICRSRSIISSKNCESIEYQVRVVVGVESKVEIEVHSHRSTTTITGDPGVPCLSLKLGG